MPAPGSPSVPFSYCVLRLVPSIERGERLNVGVVLFCRQRRFLGIRLDLDRERMAAFAGDRWPGDGPVLDHFAGLLGIVGGEPGHGPIAQLDASDRFGWVAAPSSTIVQPSEVHTGLSDDPSATLDGLFARLVGGRPTAQRTVSGR